MNKKGNYQWTVRHFNLVGAEFTMGYFDSRQEALDSLMDEKRSAFILLVDPGNERDIKSIEYIKVNKEEKGDAVVSEIIGSEKARKLYNSWYCEGELFQKVIVPPEEEFKNLKIKPMNYLIQHLGLANFLLCRELDEGEEMNQEDDITVNEGKRYIWLANFPSEEKAMEVIHLNWNAIKQLNKKVQ